MWLGPAGQVHFVGKARGLAEESDVGYERGDSKSPPVFVAKVTESSLCVRLCLTHFVCIISLI